MRTPIEHLREIGQSVWYDDISRGMIESGGLARVIDAGVTGLTSNPTIFHKAISESTDYDADMAALARAGKTTVEIYEAMAIADIRAAADLLRPIHDATGWRDGFASLEVNPQLAHDTDATIREATRLFAEVDRPNVMIKAPGTDEGIPAVETLIGEGININVTLIFSLDTYARVLEAYLAGLETLRRRGGDLRRAASVASFFVSRVDTAADAILEGSAASDGGAARLLGQAGVANARLAYARFIETFEAPRFEALRQAGARPQRPLWASTSVKNPAYDDLMYVRSLMAKDTVNTMPSTTLDILLSRGIEARHAIDASARRQAATLQRELASAGVDMGEVAAKLQRDGVQAFADSYEALLRDIEAECARLAVGISAD